MIRETLPDAVISNSAGRAGRLQEGDLVLSATVPAWQIARAVSGASMILDQGTVKAAKACSHHRTSPPPQCQAP